MGDLHCPLCGTRFLDDAQVEAARTLTVALVESLRADPYLRSAGLLSYTLRSHLRGFLDDPTHPLARRLLSYLHRLAVTAGEFAPRQLLPHAESEWVRPDAPVLARALRYVRERHPGAIEAAARHVSSAVEFDVWFREWIERDGPRPQSM